MSSPFNLDSGRLDIAITILRAKGVEVTILTVPRADKTLERVFEVLDGPTIDDLFINGIKVKRDLELEGVLIHQRLVYRNPFDQSTLFRLL